MGTADALEADARDLVTARAESETHSRWLVLGYGAGVLITIGGLTLTYAQQLFPDVLKWLNTDLRLEIGIAITTAGIVTMAWTETTRRQRYAPWLDRILDRIDYLAEELARLPKDHRTPPLYENAIERLRKAAEIARKKWYSQNAAWPKAWSALNRVGESLVMLAPVQTVHWYALGISAELAANPLPSADPRRGAFSDSLKRIQEAAHAKDQTIADLSADREALRAVMHTLNDRAESANEDLRSFLALVGRVAAGLFIMLLIVTIISSVDMFIFSICNDAVRPKCPAGSEQSPLDVLYIELLGAFGGFVFALRGLPQFKTGSVPYQLYTLQAAIKVLSGAVIALIGILALQRGLLPGVAPQPGNRVFVYALAFGLSQEFATRVLDQKFRNLIDAVPARRAGQGRERLTD